MNLKEWYRKPEPDNFRSLSNFLTKDEKQALRRIKRQIRAFRSMSIEEYEKLKSEYEEYVFSIIESFVREDDRNTIKARIHEIIDEYSILDFNNALALSIAKKIYAEYNNINCPLDDSVAYKLDEEFYELFRR